MNHFNLKKKKNSSPCFDEPGLKATYEISIDHPIGTTALSNTPKSVNLLKWFCHIFFNSIKIEFL